MNNELAQSFLLKASITAARWQTASWQIKTAQSAAAAEPSLDLDIAQWQQTAETDRTNAIESARRAVREFEKSSRDLNRNWTVAAQAAAAHDLLAWLESPAHRETAISNYEASIKGRESEPFAHPFVDRLNQLKSR